MAKKHKKESAPAAKAAVEPKKSRKKKEASVPLLPEEAPAESPAPEAATEAPPEKPAKKKGKGKAKELAPEMPVAIEAAGGDTTAQMPAVENEQNNGAEATPEAAPEAEQKAPVNLEQVARTVEALLFAAEEPLQPRELARCSGSDSATIRKLIPQIKERYAAERRSWDICEVANGFRLVTRPEFFPAIQKLKTQTMQRKLTQAALETLALIAYRQPLSRAEIENVRGVGAGPVLRQLLERKLIKISGRGTGLGQPLLYGTTDYFLEHFGLGTIQDLPKPGELKQ